MWSSSSPYLIYFYTRLVNHGDTRCFKPQVKWPCTIPSFSLLLFLFYYGSVCSFYSEEVLFSLLEIKEGKLFFLTTSVVFSCTILPCFNWIIISSVILFLFYHWPKLLSVILMGGGFLEYQPCQRIVTLWSYGSWLSYSGIHN